MNRFLLLTGLLLTSLSPALGKAAGSKPNILFCIADDWGWPHAGAYDDPVIKTPTFNRIAEAGVRFEHAYISSPSCTPSRNAILTGQYHWRLGTGANLHSTFPQRLETYPHLLEDAGYHTGYWRKSWGPGKLDGKWRERHPAGKNYKKGFRAFLESVPKGKPFCFWLGASDPHRPYKPGSGEKKGMDIGKIKLFAHYPESDIIRSDVADYYFAVERFDNDCGKAVALLEEKGLLDNTIIIMTGDHGMPFPRCKANLYDCGARVPLAISWGDKIKGQRVIEDFVSLTDLAPTYLDLAGVPIPKEMTGRSLLPMLQSKRSGKLEPTRRAFVLTGKERHVPSQEAPDSGGYPSRAIRTDDFLYIRNYAADRWPNGSPHFTKAHISGAWYADCDNGPTKSYIIDNKDKDEQHRRAYELCFAKRPRNELFDLSTDPDQLHNVAANPKYAGVLKRIQAKLDKNLKATGDPRATGAEQNWDTQPYFGNAPLAPATEVDVLVYGATPAGVCAAVAASREGASVALVSPYDYVGGMISGGLSLSDSNQCVRQLMGGLFVEIHQRIYKHYEDAGVKLNYKIDLTNNDKWTYEPHVAEKVLHDLIEEAGVAVHLEHRLVSVTKKAARIKMLKTSKGVFRAGQFIDATYEGDLMAAADVSYTVGRESKTQYGESLAGHQFPKKPVSSASLDKAGKPLPLLTGASLGEDDGDEKIMTYSFRVVVSTDPNNRRPMPEPANYDPARFELARRYIQAHPAAAGSHVAVDGYPLPGRKTDLNNGISKQISSGLVGASWAWPEATYDEREKIWEAHKQFTLELIWFLKTDPAVPEKVRKKYADYYLTKDEFTKHGGWPPALYVREGRRLIGEHVLTQHDILQDNTKDDPICISSFPIDSHDCQRVPTADGKAWINEGTIFPKRTKRNRSGQPYQVPYRSLTPKRAECVNLLVPVCLSSSHVALCSIRVEPTWMMLGQSAGVAAAMAHATKTDVQQLPYDDLKRRLLKQHQVLDLGTDAVAKPATSVGAK